MDNLDRRLETMRQHRARPHMPADSPAQEPKDPRQHFPDLWQARLANRQEPTMAVEWLASLETALWAIIPAHESLFRWEDKDLEVDRRLEEREGRVFFVETWTHPRTRQTLNTWRLEIAPGAWVGLPAALQGRTVTMLVEGIAQARPRKAPREERRTFVPSKLGQSPLLDV